MTQKPVGEQKIVRIARRSTPEADDEAQLELPIEERDEEPLDSDFWADLRDSLPPWLLEVAALALIIFGVLSFLALFDSSDAVVAVAWSNILTGLFGYGSVIVPVGLLLLGALLLLERTGLVVHFPPSRVLALEIGFFALLALLHLLSSEGELRALARAGEGGGLIGWGLSLPLNWLLGRSMAIMIYGLVLLLSALYIAGLRRSQLRAWLLARSQQLKAYSDRLTSKPAPAASAGAVPAGAAPAVQQPVLPGRRTPLMRIRANPADLPPSLRRSASKAASPTPTGASWRAGSNSEDKEDPALEAGEHPLFSGQKQLKMDFNIIGKPVKAKARGDGDYVERPDGRIKRYFTVASMKEPKRLGKRDRMLPDLNMLQDVELNMPSEDEINHNVVLIENTLLEFDIDVDVVDVQVGPTVTRYAVQPFKQKKDGDEKLFYDRTRVSKIASLVSDLALALSAKRLRLEMPVPGQSYVGIEVPNKHPSVVALRSVFESRAYYEQTANSRSPLMIPLGRDVSGAPVVVDIAKMPHLLIAGTTGSGKSVCIAAIATALVLNNRPEEVQMVMLDPKMVELSRFNGLPHLLGPVETDVERIIGVLRWCTREMDRRYKLLEEHAARNIEIYNSRQGSRRRGGDPLPYIVVLVDEIGDLMMMQPEETEKSVTRLAQMARAVGIHLVVATQRPSVDVITGLIKANFPTRISFAVASGVDSRVILDTVGAENLLGHGDMLYLANDASAARRVQGCFVSDDEVRQVVDHWRQWHEQQIKAGRASRIGIGPWERGLTRRELLAETDPMLEDAIELVVSTGEASASLIQRRLGLGYPRAARIMDLLGELGVVGESVGGGRARKVLIKPGEDPFQELVDKRTQEK